MQRALVYTPSVFEVHALLRSSSRRGATSKSAAFPMQLWIICAHRPTVVALHRARRRLPRGTRSDGDARCEFILRLSRLSPSCNPSPRLFLDERSRASDRLCAPSLPRHRRDSRRPPRSTSGSPELRRAAMLELNDEPKLMESMRAEGLDAIRDKSKMLRKGSVSVSIRRSIRRTCVLRNDGVKTGGEFYGTYFR